MELSIIIPVYNVSDYIVECLDSVGKQNVFSTECIIVDDCGTDDSMKKVYQWIEKYNGPITFKVFQNKKNSGVSASRNNGLDAACGEYVMFVDSDDYLLPNALTTLLSIKKKHPDTDIFIGCTSSNSNDFSFLNIPKSFPEFTNDTKWIQKHLVRNTTVWNKLFRRSFLKSNNIRFVENIVSEDLIFMYEVTVRTRNIAFSKSPTYYYRIRENSITTNKNRETLYQGMFYAIEKMIKGEEKKRYSIIRTFIIDNIISILKFRRPYSIVDSRWNVFDLIILRFWTKEILNLRFKNAFFLTFLLPPFSFLASNYRFRKKFLDLLNM